MSISLASEKRSIDSKKRKSFAKLPEVLEIPNLIKVQLDSFRWFQEEGLRELFEEISPIHDFTGTRLELHFVGYEFRQPTYSVDQCRQRDITYAAPLYVRARLIVKEPRGDIFW
jgi:DNA-directed RNA polymerase subunit beta